MPDSKPDGRVGSGPCRDASGSRACARSDPRDWRVWSPADKLEYLFGMSLDDIYKITSWPIGERDPFRLSVRMQVTRVVFAIGVKALLDGRLGREAAR